MKKNLLKLIAPPEWAQGYLLDLWVKKVETEHHIEASQHSIEKIQFDFKYLQHRYDELSDFLIKLKNDKHKIVNLTEILQIREDLKKIKKLKQSLQRELKAEQEIMQFMKQRLKELETQIFQERNKIIAFPKVFKSRKK